MVSAERSGWLWLHGWNAASPNPDRVGEDPIDTIAGDGYHCRDASCPVRSHSSYPFRWKRFLPWWSRYRRWRVCSAPVGMHWNLFEGRIPQRKLTGKRFSAAEKVVVALRLAGKLLKINRNDYARTHSTDGRYFFLREFGLGKRGPS